LQTFYKTFPFLEIDALVEYFSFFGGVEEHIGIDAFAGLEANIQDQLLDKFEEISSYLTPSYLLEEPYRKLLISIARGDGKMFNVFRRARLNESAGGQMINELAEIGIVRVEESREPPLVRVAGQEIPKELRGYRIQSKVRFVLPFHRFWFGFIEPYRHNLERGDDGQFWDNFRQHKDRAQSLIFEQLSNDLLVDMFFGSDPIISYGSWWDRKSEYDLLALSASGKVILGECKYKGRKITKAELTKLKDKADNTGIKVDRYVLFSRNGFSGELYGMEDENLMLKDISDYKTLLG
jgi:AAA+ ATPase superfamily predicted ATPase